MKPENLDYRSLIRNIAATDTVEDMQKTGLAIADSFGFDYFSYGTAIPLAPSQSRILILHGFPDTWWDTYLGENLLASDPFLAYCLENSVPIEWTTEETILEKLNKKKKEYSHFLELARETGFAGGISVPIHGAVGEMGMFTVTSGCFDQNRLRTTLFQSFPGIALLAEFFHDQAKKVLGCENAEKTGQLTSREKECLFWASEGKTSGETAIILNIAERTVTYHLNNVVKKLKVSSRQHAIGQASATKMFFHVLPLIPSIQESLKNNSQKQNRKNFTSLEKLTL
jgi:LuxR family transcriptional activator of bioluminescence operon